MRNLKIVAAIAFVAAVILGVAAWIAHRESVRLNAENAALAETKGKLADTRNALEQTVKRANDQTDALQGAIKDSKDYQQEQKRRARRAKDLGDGLAAAAAIRTAMTEYFMTEGRWPASNATIGAPPPEGFKADALQSLTALPDGTIRLEFRNDSGSLEHLWLHATLSAANRINWQCTTPDIPDVDQLTTNCTYQAPK